MTPTRKFCLSLLFFALLGTSKLWGQSADSLQLLRINGFFEGYNQQQFKVMRQQLGGPMKLIFTKGLLKKMFEPQFQFQGQVIEQRVIVSKARNKQIRLRYANDSTEYHQMGFAFNKKHKIVGLQMRAVNFRFPLVDSLKTNRSREDRIAAIDSSFQLKMRAGVFEGCVLVADEQGLLYQNCSGNMTENTVFELASVSKQFTAVATLQLVAQGKIELDKELSTYLPEFPYKGVTVRMLLNHTSGLPDYMALLEKHWDKKRIATNADMLALLVKHKPKRDFKPGKKHEYSNTGYALLASLIERVSGKSFADQLQISLFQPAAMSNSRVYHRRLAGKIPENLAIGRVKNPDNATYVIPDSLADYDYLYYLDGIVGDGCVNSTLSDLVRWQQALKSGRLLPDSLLQLAWQPTILPNGEKEDYGFGWSTERRENQQQLVHHSGSWPGYTTFMLFPVEGQGMVVVLSNNDYMQILNYSRRLTGWMLDRK